MALAAGREALKAALLSFAANTNENKTPEQAVDDLLDAFEPYIQQGQITIPIGTPITTTGGAGTITAPIIANIQ